MHILRDRLMEIDKKKKGPTIHISFLDHLNTELISPKCASILTFTEKHVFVDFRSFLKCTNDHCVISPTKKISITKPKTTRKIAKKNLLQKIIDFKCDWVKNRSENKKRYKINFVNLLPEIHF